MGLCLLGNYGHLQNVSKGKHWMGNKIPIIYYTVFNILQEKEIAWRYRGTSLKRNKKKLLVAKHKYNKYLKTSYWLLESTKICFKWTVLKLSSNYKEPKYK